MVSNKTTHKASKLIRLDKQNPLENCLFIFTTIYQNYSLVL